MSATGVVDASPVEKPCAQVGPRNEAGEKELEAPVEEKRGTDSGKEGERNWSDSLKYVIIPVQNTSEFKFCRFH